ncbi:MAG: ATP synthase F1 subunit delta [Thermoflexibacteraceae bacterium]
MSEIQVSARYAKSIIDLANERGQLDEVHKDMMLFINTCEVNRPLRLLLSNPIVNTYKKSQILKEIFSGKITALTTSFFQIILRKTRESLLFDIAVEFDRQYGVQNNLQTAEVITAAELTDDLRSQLANLAGRIAVGKKITLKEYVKPEIIGGFILKVQDKQIDQSIQSRLKNIIVQITT